MHCHAHAVQAGRIHALTQRCRALRVSLHAVHAHVRLLGQLIGQASVPCANHKAAATALPALVDYAPSHRAGWRVGAFVLVGRGIWRSGNRTRVLNGLRGIAGDFPFCCADQEASLRDREAPGLPVRLRLPEGLAFAGVDGSHAVFPSEHQCIAGQDHRVRAALVGLPLGAVCKFRAFDPGFRVVRADLAAA